MKIVAVTAKVFAYESHTMKDTDGHTHPGPPRRVANA